jgi:hypothetical protein
MRLSATGPSVATTCVQLVLRVVFPRADQAVTDSARSSRSQCYVVVTRAVSLTGVRGRRRRGTQGSLRSNFLRTISRRSCRSR